MQNLTSVARRLLRRLRGQVFPAISRQSRVREVAALTMVYESPALLAKWVQHYGDLFGRENLFIVSHGPSPAHEEVAAGCNYLVVPRETIVDIGSVKAALLSNMSAGLLAIYDAVICGDVDELVVLDPNAHPGSLKEYVLSLPGDAAVAPLGFDIVPDEAYFDEGGRATIARPLLRQVNRLVFDWEFCKPSVLKSPKTLSIGQHGLIGSRFALDENLVLIHLKFLALNPPDFYRRVSDEVAAAAAADRKVGNEFWAAGLGRLKEYAASMGDPGSAIPTLEPREASRGCYSFDQSRLPPGADIGDSFRLAPAGRARVFALPERWLDLV